jgi:glycosyltransferase involved in cell wall biosynthesis
MRILHLANHCRFGNGNVHAAVDLACEQVLAGHEVMFASGGGDFEVLLARNGVVHHIIPQHARSPRSLATSLFRLSRLLRVAKPDIVHSHMMTGTLLAYPLTRGKRPKLVTTVHNAFDRHAILMGLGDRVIAVSQSVAANMQKRGVKVAKLRTVLNGTLGAVRRASMSKEAAVLSAPSIVTLCGLHHRKGVQDLIAAFDIISKVNGEVNLYIIGEGPEEKTYRTLAQQLAHGDRIHFLGLIRDPNPQLLGADIFVLASLQDPCPLVITEAREAGCAVVGSNVDGIPEILSVGNAGALFEPQNPQSIVDAILPLLNDADLLRAGKAASLREIDYFNISRVRKEVDNVYLDLL